MAASIQRNAQARMFLCMLLSVALAAPMVPVVAFAAPSDDPVVSNELVEKKDEPTKDSAESEASLDLGSGHDEASESPNGDGAEASNDGYGVTPIEGDVVIETSTSSNSSRISVSLAYAGETVSSNGSIACGKPVQFTLNASGGSGAYKYLLSSVDLLVDGALQPVHDGTWNLALTDENTFEYTFIASGVYYIYWTAYDAVDLGNASHVYQSVIVSDPSAPSIEVLAQRVVDDCSAQGFATEYEKALFYNDYIVDNTEYDSASTNSGAVGVFVKDADGANGSATCEGYYRAFKMLLDRSGIQCVRTPGGGHVWATVRLDGIWTQVDPTWNDDQYAPLKNLYFGLTDEMSELVHSGYARNPAYRCDSYERNYLYRSGIVGLAADEAASTINANLNAGQRSFELTLKSYYPYSEPYHCFYPMMIAELEKRSWGEHKLGIAYIKDVSDMPQSLTNSYLRVNVECAHENVGDWRSDATSHWAMCVDCGAMVNKEDHSFGAWSSSSSNLFYASEQVRICNVCDHASRSALEAKLPAYRSYSFVYDPVYYAKGNQDVVRAYGGDEVQIFYHFLNNGIAEGRCGSASFDVVSYYNANPDLRRAFGTDLWALTMHYMNQGRREGRTVKGVADIRGFISARGGIDYAPVYDGKRYRDAHADLKRAFTRRFPAGIALFDDAALLDHFLNNGIAEGRVASDDFNVHTYKSRYSDLRAAFGYDLKKYMMHYITSGKYEGRIAS